MPKKDANIIFRYPSKCILPEEIIALIIAFGTLDYMKGWRGVSRTFKAVVDKSPIFQYLVELTQLEILRGYQKKLGQLTGSDYVAIDFQEVESRPNQVNFFRGLFAHLYPAGEGTEPDGIFIYELPSLNRPFPQCKIWSLDASGPIKEYYIDKSMDLMIFFMHDENAGNIPVLRIDLRSLNTGGDHPAAAKPNLQLPITGTLEKVYSCLTGDYLLVLLDAESSDDAYDIVVWDWPSGEQIMHMRPEGRDSFAFVLPNILILPSSLSKPDEDLELIGHLDIFTFDPDGRNASPQHIATLQLPGTADKAATTYVTVCSSRSPCLKSRTVPTSQAEARLYDVSPSDGVVCLKIIYFPGVDPKNATYPRPSCSGFLLVHHESILDIIHSLPQSGYPHVIPWSEWAHKTVWTGASAENLPIAQVSTFGHRVTFLRKRDIVVYDLRPCFLNIDSSSSSLTRKTRFKKPPRRPARVARLDSLFKSGRNRASSPKILTSITVPRDIEIIEPTIVMDEEHVILVPDSEWELGGGMYLYSLYPSLEELPQRFGVSDGRKREWVH
ncbi:hypothetical protein OPQ81_001168 [Rhizoctonia solani]|nr:hypothetical protein OPQ81_001168 [Rhizoctonia solani]